MRYHHKPHKKRQHIGISDKVWSLLIFLVVLTIIIIFTSLHIYNQDLKPVSNNQTVHIVTIDSGSGVTQIANKLKNEQLIRSVWAFDLYIKKNRDVASHLQAGTYALNQSQSLPDIVDIISQGRVSVKLVTILPGSRIDQIRATLINAGFTPSSVDSALDPSQYSNLPVLAIKPPSVGTLEGLLWPDSFEKGQNTDPSSIIRESLNETEAHLTPDVTSAFSNEGLNTYQGLVLSSIIIQEENKPADQPQVAQVLLSRLKAGMMLESDVTVRYGAIVAGQTPTVNYASPYNTYLNPGLPPTPISTISTQSLYSATHPANTNWLYFVAGDNGNTYFSTNLADHQALTKQYCHKLCGN